MSRLRERMVGLLLMAGSVLVSLAGAELVLRALGFSYPSFWMPDALTGARLRPGAEGWNRREGEAHVKINSDGLRDVEHTVRKPSGVYRIAVLGDSYAEALQVRLEETFWWRLAKRLEACGFRPGQRIEAVNFGVSGYGTAQQLLSLRHRAWRYSPDMVLLAFFPGNDVRNNSRQLEPERERPFFVLRGGELALDDSFAAQPAFVETARVSGQRAALQELRLYQLLRRLRAGAPTVNRDTALAMGEDGVDEEVFRPPSAPAWIEAWAITEKLILELQSEARMRDARFLVAVLSTAAAVHPDASLRRQYAGELGVPDLFYPETRLAALGERHGIEVLTLARHMARHAEATGVHLHGFANAIPGFGHWNAAGHGLAAELIAQELCPAHPLAAKVPPA